MHIWYCYKCVVSNTAFQQPQTQYSIFTVTSIFLPTVQGFLQDSPFIVHMHVKVHSTDTWVPSIPCIRMYAYSHIGMIDLAYIGLYMSFCISFWCGQKVAIMIQTRKIGRYKNKKEMLAILTRKQNIVTCMDINYDTVEQYCTLWRCDKTPPPGLTTCHECPRSSPAIWTHTSAPQWSLLSACLYDSVWVHLMPKVAYHRPMSSPWVAAHWACGTDELKHCHRDKQRGETIEELSGWWTTGRCCQLRVIVLLIIPLFWVWIKIATGTNNIAFW